MPEVRQNNPTGKSLKTLSIPPRKNIPLASSGKSAALIRASRGGWGALAIVTNARWDAVDARAATGECGSSVRRSRVVL